MKKTLYKTNPKTKRNRYIHIILHGSRTVGGIGIAWNYDPDMYALHNFLSIRIGLVVILELSIQWGR